jgi:hypothetical protein
MQSGTKRKAAIQADRERTEGTAGSGSKASQPSTAGNDHAHTGDVSPATSSTGSSLKTVKRWGSLMTGSAVLCVYECACV